MGLDDCDSNHIDHTAFDSYYSYYGAMAMHFYGTMPFIRISATISPDCDADITLDVATDTPRTVGIRTSSDGKSWTSVFSSDVTESGQIHHELTDIPQFLRACLGCTESDACGEDNADVYTTCGEGSEESSIPWWTWLFVAFSACCCVCAVILGVSAWRRKNQVAQVPEALRAPQVQLKRIRGF